MEGQQRCGVGSARQVGGDVAGSDGPERSEDRPSTETKRLLHRLLLSTHPRRLDEKFKRRANSHETSERQTDTWLEPRRAQPTLFSVYERRNEGAERGRHERGRAGRNGRLPAQQNRAREATVFGRHEYQPMRSDGGGLMRTILPPDLSAALRRQQAPERAASASAAGVQTLLSMTGLTPRKDCPPIALARAVQASHPSSGETTKTQPTHVASRSTQVKRHEW